RYSSTLVILREMIPTAVGRMDSKNLLTFGTNGLGVVSFRSYANKPREILRQAQNDTAFITTSMSWCLSRVIRGVQRSGVESISWRLSASVLKDFSFWMLRGYRLRFFRPTLAPSLSAGRTRRETHNNEFGQFP